MIIEQELNELEALIPEIHRLKPEVSVRSVGWHVVHSLEVIGSILRALKKSKPERYKRKFNFLRFVLFRFNRFPRGKAKAPRIVQPEPEKISKDQIETLLKEVRIDVLELDDFDPNSYFRHPYFGKLNIEHTRKFLRLHTRHHLKIIKDIIEN